MRQGFTVSKAAAAKYKKHFRECPSPKKKNDEANKVFLFINETKYFYSAKYSNFVFIASHVTGESLFNELSVRLSAKYMLNSIPKKNSTEIEWRASIVENNKNLFPLVPPHLVTLFTISEAENVASDNDSLTNAVKRRIVKNVEKKYFSKNWQIRHSDTGWDGEGTNVAFIYGEGADEKSDYMKKKYPEIEGIGSDTTLSRKGERDFALLVLKDFHEKTDLAQTSFENKISWYKFSKKSKRNAITELLKDVSVEKEKTDDLYNHVYDDDQKYDFSPRIIMFDDAVTKAQHALRRDPKISNFAKMSDFVPKEWVRMILFMGRILAYNSVPFYEILDHLYRFVPLEKIPLARDILEWDMPFSICESFSDTQTVRIYTILASVFSILNKTETKKNTVRGKDGIDGVVEALMDELKLEGDLMKKKVAEAIGVVKKRNLLIISIIDRENKNYDGLSQSNRDFLGMTRIDVFARVNRWEGKISFTRKEIRGEKEHTVLLSTYAEISNSFWSAAFPDLNDTEFGTTQVQQIAFIINSYWNKYTAMGGPETYEKSVTKFFNFDEETKEKIDWLLRIEHPRNYLLHGFKTRIFEVDEGTRKMEIFIRDVVSVNCEDGTFIDDDKDAAVVENFKEWAYVDFVFSKEEVSKIYHGFYDRKGHSLWAVLNEISLENFDEEYSFYGKDFANAIVVKYPLLKRFFRFSVLEKIGEIMNSFKKEVSKNTESFAYTKANIPPRMFWSEKLYALQKTVSKLFSNEATLSNEKSFVRYLKEKTMYFDYGEDENAKIDNIFDDYAKRDAKKMFAEKTEGFDVFRAARRVVLLKRRSGDSSVPWEKKASGKTNGSYTVVFVKESKKTAGGLTQLRIIIRSDNVEKLQLMGETFPYSGETSKPHLDLRTRVMIESGRLCQKLCIVLVNSLKETTSSFRQMIGELRETTTYQPLSKMLSDAGGKGKKWHGKEGAKTIVRTVYLQMQMFLEQVYFVEKIIGFRYLNSGSAQFLKEIAVDKNEKFENFSKLYQKIFENTEPVVNVGDIFENGVFEKTDEANFLFGGRQSFDDSEVLENIQFYLHKMFSSLANRIDPDHPVKSEKDADPGSFLAKYDLLRDDHFSDKNLKLFLEKDKPKKSKRKDVMDSEKTIESAPNPTKSAKRAKTEKPTVGKSSKKRERAEITVSNTTLPTPDVVPTAEKEAEPAKKPDKRTKLNTSDVVPTSEREAESAKKPDKRTNLDTNDVVPTAEKEAEPAKKPDKRTELNTNDVVNTNKPVENTVSSPKKDLPSPVISEDDSVYENNEKNSVSVDEMNDSDVSENFSQNTKCDGVLTTKLEVNNRQKRLVYIKLEICAGVSKEKDFLGLEKTIFGMIQTILKKNGDTTSLRILRNYLHKINVGDKNRTFDPEKVYQRIFGKERDGSESPAPIPEDSSTFESEKKSNQQESGVKINHQESVVVISNNDLKNDSDSDDMTDSKENVEDGGSNGVIDESTKNHSVEKDNDESEGDVDDDNDVMTDGVVKITTKNIIINTSNKSYEKDDGDDDDSSKDADRPDFDDKEKNDVDDSMKDGFEISSKEESDKEPEDVSRDDDDNDDDDDDDDDSEKESDIGNESQDFVGDDYGDDDSMKDGFEISSKEESDKELEGVLRVDDDDDSKKESDIGNDSQDVMKDDAPLVDEEKDIDKKMWEKVSRVSNYAVSIADEQILTPLQDMADVKTIFEMDGISKNMVVVKVSGSVRTQEAFLKAIVKHTYFVEKTNRPYLSNGGRPNSLLMRFDNLHLVGGKYIKKRYKDGQNGTQPYLRFALYFMDKMKSAKLAFLKETLIPPVIFSQRGKFVTFVGDDELFTVYIVADHISYTHYNGFPKTYSLLDHAVSVSEQSRLILNLNIVPNTEMFLVQLLDRMVVGCKNPHINQTSVIPFVHGKYTNQQHLTIIQGYTNFGSFEKRNLFEVNDYVKDKEVNVANISQIQKSLFMALCEQRTLLIERYTKLLVLIHDVHEKKKDNKLMKELASFENRLGDITPQLRTMGQNCVKIIHFLTTVLTNHRKGGRQPLFDDILKANPLFTLFE